MARIYDAAWQRVRLLVLERDAFICRVNGPACVSYATEVDHVVPVLAGGARLDPANLRASCKPCNSGRANRGRSREVVRAEVLAEVGGYPEPWRP